MGKAEKVYQLVHEHTYGRIKTTKALAEAIYDAAIEDAIEAVPKIIPTDLKADTAEKWFAICCNITRRNLKALNK